MKRLIAVAVSLAYILPVLVSSTAEAGDVIAAPSDCTGNFGPLRTVCLQAYNWPTRDQLFIRDIDQLSGSDSAAVRSALVDAETAWNTLPQAGPQRFAILPNIDDTYNFLKPSTPEATEANVALTKRCGTFLGTPNVCITTTDTAMDAEWTELLTLVDPALGVGSCFPCQSYAGQKHLVEHEWGHVLGLGHHGNCTDQSPTLMCRGSDLGNGQFVGSIEAGSPSDCKGGGGSSDDGIRCIYDWYNCSDPDCDDRTGSADNCASAPNETQLDGDGESFSLAPVFPTVTDWTNVVAYDPNGDICDDDDDGDGLSTAQELLFVPCYPVSTGPTDPLNDDSDGDRFKDGVECLVGSDPVNPNTRPATSPDQDNDGLQDGLEFLVFNTSITDPDSDNDFITDGAEALRYGSNPNASNSDSSVETLQCGDRREAASVNADYGVTAGDLGMVASKFGAYSGFDHQRRDVDFNRDGSITSGDLANVASAFGACP